MHDLWSVAVGGLRPLMKPADGCDGDGGGVEVAIVASHR